MPIYSEYKAATDSFVKWVIKTAAKINPLSKGLPNTVENISRRAELISGCETIHPFLMEDDYLPAVEDVLLDGLKAINLRKIRNKLHLRASELSGKMNESDRKHTHFVFILESARSKIKAWYNKLAVQLDSPSGSDDIDSHGNTANIFSILSDDSLADDGDDLDDLCGQMDSSSIDDSNAVRDFNVDEIDEDEEKVKTIVLCFIIDMISLMRKVENAWKQVAEDTMHVVVAVSISVTVIQALDRQFTELQSQLPSIDEATTFLVSICDSFLSRAKIGDCELSKFYDKMMMYLKILSKFAHTTLRDVTLRGSLSATHNLPEDRPRFIEQYSLLSMTPSGVEEFLFVQLCLLHRKIDILVLQKLSLDEVYINLPSSKLFLRSFHTFFQTKIVSVALLVRCMIWVQIISVLQDSDQLTMGRTIYIMRKYCRRVIKLLSPDEEVLGYSAHLPPFESRKFFINDNVNVNLDDNYKLFHHNPLLQGMHLLDLIIQNEGGMSCTFLANGESLFQLYSFMIKEGLVNGEIKDIPIFDLLLSTTGLSRDSASKISRGNYLSSSFLEIERRARLMEEYFDPTKRHRNRRGRTAVKVYTSGKKILTTASVLYFFLFEQDLSTLDVERPLSSSELVETIAEIVRVGLFEKRTLSLSAIKFGRIFNGVFLRVASMFPELIEKMRSSGIYPPNGICEDPYQLSGLAGVCKLEINTRILGQLDKLDSLNEENSLKLSDLCKRIGTIIVDTLKPIQLENELYIFKTDEKGAILREFGDQQLINFTDRETQSVPMTLMVFQNICMPVFFDMQGQFERFLSRPASEIANDKVRNKFIDALKSIIKDVPGCLQLVNLLNTRFGTIFDYAVCALKDMDFAEWIVQMRGFLPRGAQFLRFDLSGRGKIPGGVDQTHLQCACQHQVTWAIDFILAVSQGIDRNFVGYDCDNTALHYIVKMGDPMNVISFMDYGSFIQIRDNNEGKAPFDLAETKEMKSCLKSFGVKLCDFDDYNTQLRSMQKEANKVTGRELDTFRTQSSSVRRNTRLEASTLCAVSSEDITRAEQAEKELLKMLDAEETAKEKGTKKTSKKSGKTKKK